MRKIWKLKRETHLVLLLFRVSERSERRREGGGDGGKGGRRERCKSLNLSVYVALLIYFTTGKMKSLRFTFLRESLE